MWYVNMGGCNKDNDNIEQSNMFCVMLKLDDQTLQNRHASTWVQYYQ